jgi:hypothetical protein
VNFLQDRVAHIFGSDVFTRFSEFVALRGLDDGADERLVEDEPTLRALLDHLLAAEDAPDVPDEDYAWSASEPGTSRARWRRAVPNRRRTAELARALPRRPRVAGRRSREAEWIRNDCVPLHA